MASIFTLLYITSIVSLVDVAASDGIHLTDLKYTTHPMLYFNDTDLPKLQQKAMTTHRKIADLLQDATVTMIEKPDLYLPSLDYETFGGKWNEMYGNNLCALAMYCVLFPEDDEAFKYTVEFMDRMAELPKWQVISLPKDEVPVAHSLTGFTTAFDFLYPALDPKRRMIYLRKLLQVTKEFYFYSKHRAWGSFYLQNHVATNYLALIHGSLVVSVHYRPALFWLKEALKMFERTMLLLNHIVDGSLDEGVPYGSYTSRSVTQYIYLVRRHFDIDHTQDFWIRQHFNFYYHTIMPQFQRTVGIGDSNNNWFYGPESQLVFLDAYVLKNGYGNWLANEIREHRATDSSEKLIPAQHQLWCTLHTEFIWFDPNITPKMPPHSGKPNLHVFNDWGVVTYSAINPSAKGDTFFAFKSGRMHGRAVFDVVQKGMYSWVKGWRSFNPGHEHPDQSMFVFAPNGNLFITDGLYAPKFTYLNNVLSFYPSPSSRCFQPWEGQLGECDKYLRWKSPSVKRYGGELIAAFHQNGMVFTSGEALDAYSNDMKLESVYRSLVLLNSNLLLVLDHIQAKSSSPISHFSAFFHNLQTSFEQDKFNSKLAGVKIPTPSGMMRMYWMNERGGSPRALLRKMTMEHTSQYQPRETNFVNVTLKMSPKLVTRVAYVLLGPSETLKDLKFSHRQKVGTTVIVKTDQESYTVAIATSHGNPVLRQEYLGHPGFAEVKLSNGSVIPFGVNLNQRNQHQLIFDTTDISNMCTYNSSFSFVFIVALSWIIICFYLYLFRKRQRRRIKRRSIIVCVSIVFLMIFVTQTLMKCDSGAHHSTQLARNMLSSVVITSLPGSGAELMGWVFYNNPDFAFIEAPSELIDIPSKGGYEINPFVDACVWTGEDLDEYPILKSWIVVLYSDLFSALSSSKSEQRSSEDDPSQDRIFKDYTKDDLLNHLKNYPDAQTVLHLTSGSWGLKLQWVQSILDNRMRAIHIVRDPRAWVANFLRNDCELHKKYAVQQEISLMFKQADKTCVPRGRYIKEFHQLRFHRSRQKLHVQLAYIWAASTRAVLTQVMAIPESNARVVRFEDLVMDGLETTEVIYDFIGE